MIITIGSFDGVHLGHQALLHRTASEAKKRNLKSLALTFSVPPRMILDPNLHYRILSTLEEKKTLLLRHGVDKVKGLDFDHKFAALKPFSFFRSVLLNELKAKGVVVGADFRFGSGRSAGALELVRWGQEFEIPIWVVSAIRHQGKIVSSSLIRHLLETNHFKQALGFLGHPYLIEGAVVAGRGLGRKLGAPTANLAVPPGKILPRGVFVVRGRILGSRRPEFSGVCNIGVRPTVLKRSSTVVEVYLFDRDGDMKGKKIQVDLLQFLRPEKKFGNVDLLKAAIARDVRRARVFLSRNPAAN